MGYLKTFIKQLGPGLLFASAAIGTSHLVLSTKAGATYGWIMIIPILLANLFKYPFFEFGIRFTNITKKSLLEGYLDKGKGYLWVYTIATVMSILTILAVLYTVTAGLLIRLLPIFGDHLIEVTLGLFLFVTLVLIIGRYYFLEQSLKVIVLLLFIALFVTTIMVIYKGPAPRVANFEAPYFFNNAGILFLISLMGWMPTAVEASSWVSLWSMEKIKINKDEKLKDALSEFKFGYILTAVLSLFFMIIGLYTLFGTGVEMSGNSVVFADQLINLFTDHIGQWAYFFIALAAFATMFSSCMTAHDALARISVDTIKFLFLNREEPNKHLLTIFILIQTIVGFSVVYFFGANMGVLIAIATFVSFMMAPGIGLLNHSLVIDKKIPAELRPSKGLQRLSYAGIVFLSLFALYYFYELLF